MPEVESDKTSIGLYFQDVDDGPLLTREQEVVLAKRMDAARYRDEEGKVSFTRIWRDGVDKRVLHRAIRARDKMITANLRLVAKIAKKYQNRGCDLEDLIQEGNLGLIRGVDGYDYTKTHTDEKTGKTHNIKLSTYCTSWIHQRINRLIQNHSRTVRIPVHVQTLSTKLQKLIDKHVSKTGSQPTVDHLLKLVNEAAQGTKQNPKTRDAVGQALACPQMHTVSLDKTNHWTENADTLHNCIPDNKVEGFEDSIFRQEMIEAVRATMHRLTPREEKIARLRFGIAEDPLRHDLKPITKGQVEELKTKSRKDQKPTT